MLYNDKHKDNCFFYFMVKKIYDIIPPREEGEFFKKKERKEKKTFLLKKAFIIPLIFLLALGGLFYFSTEPKASVNIWLETDNSTFKTNLNVDANINNLDLTNKVIPGEIIEIDKTVSQEFSSSGDSLKKAKGTIRLFNQFATWPETWAEGTRFVSGDGKLFKSESKIFVPAAKKEGSKTVASFVDVEVVAAESGVEYNIKPTHFSIYVYRGTARYSYYWGESYENMDGGGKTLKVTQSDLDNAENVLFQKALSESKSYFISTTEESFDNSIIIEELIESEITEFSPLAKPSQELNSFVAQAKAKSRAVIFKEEDLEDFARLHILSKIEEGKEIFPDSLEIAYSPSFLSGNGGEKIKDESIFLNLNLSAETYRKIDLSFLKRKILGKSSSEAKSIILNNFSGIKEVEIEIWPFWTKKTPINLGQIEINLNRNL